MNTSKRLTSYLPILFTVVCLFFIGGCNSTDEPIEEPQCRSEKQESCDAGDETQRGYDPCLVNKNLPVCEP
ncbi:hypothetical protein Q4574_19620 [Aliiglaciecola sp. 3_MG-2023]|uniref:hypothetical protein n=1 Tax=Aliiglaciecola sp. 3_MG-2023 TaxID=3062644 RepID=UPI0026E3E200|nr:hypothetical protein [Aliiglaciecola sp. 3_MG-2023]MDO6695518.1 hypothetical protein [Aliiglaciecola sp. 3_MG-2023]